MQISACINKNTSELVEEAPAHRHVKISQDSMNIMLSLSLWINNEAIQEELKAGVRLGVAMGKLS